MFQNPGTIPASATDTVTESGEELAGLGRELHSTYFSINEAIYIVYVRSGLFFLVNDLFADSPFLSFYSRQTFSNLDDTINFCLALMCAFVCTRVRACGFTHLLESRTEWRHWKSEHLHAAHKHLKI